jgi:urease accessory protein
MRVSLADVGRRGRMSLVFGLQDGRTILKDSYCEVPFKITRLLNSNGEIPHLILMQCTAGLFGGDAVECSIRLEKGSRVCITQQSATKVHPSQDRQAIQTNRIFVEEGASLQLYLEPIIPFSESRLNQSTRIEVESGGELAYWEGFMPGRVGRGESWRFRELASETSLYAGGKLKYLDRFRLTEGSVAASHWAMGSGSHMGTGLRLSSRATYFAEKLHEALPQAGVDALSETLAAVRVVLNDGPEFHRTRALFEQLGNWGR